MFLLCWIPDMDSGCLVSDEQKFDSLRRCYECGASTADENKNPRNPILNQQTHQQVGFWNQVLLKGLVVHFY
ncbi:hypothetical protein AAG906_013943 [Vitis piasezkii]